MKASPVTDSEQSDGPMAVAVNEAPKADASLSGAQTDVQNAGLDGTAAHSTVASFSVLLDGWDALIASDSPGLTLETRLLACLDHPVRLLRWAVVAVDRSHPNGSFRCEGAYLKRQAG